MANALDFYCRGGRTGGCLGLVPRQHPPPGCFGPSLVVAEDGEFRRRDPRNGLRRRRRDRLLPGTELHDPRCPTTFADRRCSAVVGHGRPSNPRLAVVSRRVSAALFAALHSRTVRALSNPLAALILSMGTMYVYFLTPLYRFSEEHPVFLAYVHLQFFLAGCALWWLVVGRDALARRLGVGMRFVLVLVQAPCDAALGLVIAMATKAFYPAGNTLADTQTGGNVLLGLAEVLIVAVLALMFVEWARRRTQGRRSGPPARRSPGRRASGYRLWRARFRT